MWFAMIGNCHALGRLTAKNRRQTQLVANREGSPLEPALLGVAALVGLLTASNLAVGPYWCTFIAALVGLLLGTDSTQELLTGRERLVSLFGSGVGIYLLFLYPMALADYANKKHWQKIGVRVIGSWVAASSMLVLALSLSSVAAK
jgi:hypothetical protein